MKKLAIIVPGYNCEAYIQKCLNSILNQKYQDFTVFFVDDGSTDSTRKIVTAIKDERLIYIYQLNAGVSAARNNGLVASKDYEYVMFVDADDWIEKDSLATIADCVNKSGNADYILFDWNEYRDANGEKEPVHCKMNDDFKDNFTLESILKHLARSRTGGSPWGKVFRNEIILNNNLRFIEGLPYAEDYLFNISFLQNAKNVNYYPITIYGYNCTHIGARAKFRKNLIDIYIQIEREKIRLYSAIYNEYSDMLLAEQLEQMTIALRNLGHTSFSHKERELERAKVKDFFNEQNIGIRKLIKSNTNIKVKAYVLLFLLSKN